MTSEIQILNEDEVHVGGDHRGVDSSSDMSDSVVIQ